MAIAKHNAMQFQFSFVHNNDFSILTKHNAYQSSGPVVQFHIDIKLNSN